jgi:hypothetical protein
MARLDLARNFEGRISGREIDEVSERGTCEGFYVLSTFFTIKVTVDDFCMFVNRAFNPLIRSQSVELSVWTSGNFRNI